LFKTIKADNTIKVVENYNAIIAENKDIKPIEFLEVQEKLKIADAEADAFVCKVSLLFTSYMIFLLACVALVYISLEDYKTAVKIYKILNGIYNDKPVEIKEWRG
jgi:hypothetical protein